MNNAPDPTLAGWRARLRPETLAALDLMAREQPIAGSTPDGEMSILADRLEEIGARTVLQLGTYLGWSALIIADLISARGGTLYTIDPEASYLHIAARYARIAGLENIVYVAKSSTDAQLIGLAERQEWDAIYIDTTHHYSQTKQELEIYAGKVAQPRTYIFMHDASDHARGQDVEGRGGVKAAILEWAEQHPEWDAYIFEPPHYPDAIWGLGELSRAGAPAPLHLGGTFTTLGARAPKPERSVIYTALYGGYYPALQPLPDQGIPAIAFTDDPKLQGEGWEIRLVERPEPTARLRAKWFKMNPHECLPDFTRSIWLDAGWRVQTPVFAREAFGFLNGSAAIFYPHRWHKNIRQELAAYVHPKMAGQPCAEQVACYLDQGMPEDAPILEATSLVRRHLEPEIITLDRSWWWENTVWTDCDQLSLPFVLWKLGTPYARFPFNLNDQTWFRNKNWRAD